MNYSLDVSKTLLFLNHLIKTDDFSTDFKVLKHQIDCLDSEGRLAFKIKLPWLLPPLTNFKEISDYIENAWHSPLYYLIVLIQAGYSALGTAVNGEIINHKVIQKYMVRKKQGKAQITYLHAKGKSRAGSRMRLAQTVEFFEEINQKLFEWSAVQEFERILISCPVRLWGMLYQSRVKPPFEKRDPRILKIPVDVQVPKYRELLRINFLAQLGNVEIHQEGIVDFVESIINRIIESKE